MRFYIILMVGLAMTGLSCDKLGGSSKPENRVDSMSYALGQNWGSGLQNDVIENGIELNTEVLMQGLRTSASGDSNNLKLSDQEVQVLLLELQRMMQAQQPQQPQQPTSNANPNQPTTNIEVGMQAPDFSQPTPDGDELRLSDLRGQYVLVDFWASWCRPCRLENPNVVRIYNQYKDKGFEILGVSLDRNREAWLKAIEQDNLGWKHVSDLGFWQNAVAQAYGVSAIPYTVLVDPEGNIVATELRGGSLEAKLAEVLGDS